MALEKVLDTNAVLYFLGGRLAESLPEGRYLLSVVAEMELLSYPSLDAREEERIRAFLSEVTLVELTREVREVAIQLRSQHGLRLPDAIIAATAQTLRAEWLTNDRKLLRIPELSCRRLRLKEN